MRLRRAGFLVAAAGLLAARAVAQIAPGDPPAAPLPPPIAITHSDGPVDLVRSGRIEAARAPDVFDEDERLVTNAGRVELVFADGAMAHVDQDTDVRVDPGVVLRLVTGRLVVRTPAAGEGLLMATPAGVVSLEPRGEYILAAGDLAGDTEISVNEGRAVMRAGDHDVVVAPGTALLMNPRDLVPRWARQRPPDAFEAWARARADEADAARRTALPSELQPWAADLAAHGQWSPLAPYGLVWFPASGPAWRPFAAGAWRHTRYGWTWIDADAWTWPLHHYGRWGHQAGRGWYWIPHRQWGPAWVGWAVAAEHVAWAPLGWNGRPLVDFSAGARVGPTGFWASSWSIVPRHLFATGGAVRGHLENPQRLPGPVLGGFVSQMIGPRGPASDRDLYAVRTRRPAASEWRAPQRPAELGVHPRPDGPPSAAVTPPAPAAVLPPVHRPTDAPPRWRDDAGAATIARPGDRTWSTAPADPAVDGRRRVPVGPPVRPRPTPDDAASGERPVLPPSPGAPSADRDRGRAWDGARGARQQPAPGETTTGESGASQPAGRARPAPAPPGAHRRGDGRGGGASGAEPSRRRPG